MPSDTQPRPRWPLRLAQRLLDCFQAFRQSHGDRLTGELDHLLGRCEHLKRLRHRLDLCRQYTLPGAARQVRDELRDCLASLGYDLEQAQKTIPQEVTDRPALTLSDLYHDLQQLQQEFGGWDWDPREGVLSVTTDTITLEGLYLGPFEIRLDLKRLGLIPGGGGGGRHRPLYTVVAQEPQYAAGNEHVTHPHVSDEVLCEGDAAPGIRKALEEGRISDFFLLVRSVLTTYNPHSPYVAIEHWEGHSCHDCGSLISHDSSFYCESCDHDYCSDCTGTCHGCDDSFCNGCLQECPFCQQWFCHNCMQACRDCGHKCCPSCLNDDDLCPDCIPEPGPDPHDQTPYIQGDDHDAALAPGVGIKDGLSSDEAGTIAAAGSPAAHEAGTEPPAAGNDRPVPGAAVQPA